MLSNGSCDSLNKVQKQKIQTNADSNTKHHSRWTRPTITGSARETFSITRFVLAPKGRSMWPLFFSMGESRLSSWLQMISFVDFESDSFRIFTRVDPKVGKPSASGDISTLHLAINRDSMDIWNVLAERLEMSDEEKLYQMNRFICQYYFLFLCVLSEEDNMNRTMWTYGQYEQVDQVRIRGGRRSLQSLQRAFVIFSC